MKLLHCINNANEYYFTPTEYVVDILGCGGSGSCSTVVTGDAPEAVQEDNNYYHTILYSMIHLHWRAKTHGYIATREKQKAEPNHSSYYTTGSTETR